MLTVPTAAELKLEEGRMTHHVNRPEAHSRAFERVPPPILPTDLGGKFSRNAVVPLFRMNTDVILSLFPARRRGESVAKFAEIEVIDNIGFHRAFDEHETFIIYCYPYLPAGREFPLDHRLVIHVLLLRQAAIASITSY